MKIPFAILILVQVCAPLYAFEPALGEPGDKYLAFWLTRDPPPADRTEEEPVLLLTRLPLKQLPELFDLRQLHDRLVKPRSDEPLLEALALTIETYKKDSIWNADRRPLKAVQKIASVNDETRHVVVNGNAYRYEECPLAEVVRLLERPQGKIPIHRIHAPLAGATQTARALRALLKEQVASEKRE